MKAEDWNVTVGSGKDQRKLQVKIESHEGDVYRVRIGDETTTVRAVRIENGSYSLIDEMGRQRGIDFDGMLPEAKLSIDGGDAISVVVQDAQSLLDAAAADASVGEIRASMPGKVVKVLCKVGDVVKSGQALLIIEAMKMENELRATGSGKVESISVREGQTVEGGQALLVLGGVS